MAQEEKMILEKVKSVLETGDMATKANFSNLEIGLIKDLHLLTLKPFLFVYNVSGNTDGKNRLALNLQFEAEIAEMSEDEAKEFESESRLPDLIKEAYSLLNLITFFTIGEDETRGWTIMAGSTAPQAGAEIHTDFEQKFIKAEVINWQKLLECKTWANARQKGLLRTEGKDYIVSDGDVIEFKI